MMSVIEAIHKRRSIRHYLPDSIPDNDIRQMLLAATMAPSGKNGQPWRFTVVTDKEILKRLARVSLHGRFLKEAPCAVLVFLDKTCSYDYTKDSMAIGASIQNILLTATALGYGSCWIGGIDPQDEQVKMLVNMEESLLLMSVIAIGYANEKPKAPEHKTIKQVTAIITSK